MELSTNKLMKKFKSSLMSNLLRLRAVTDKDCEDIYNWRNHELNRKYSLNPEIIAWETHRDWFKARIDSDLTKILIVNYFKKKIAVIVFKLEEPSPEISIYLVPGMHGKGHGLSVLLAAEKWLRNNHTANSINARIIPENIASISIFKLAGYKFVNSEKNYQVWQKKVRCK